MSGKVISDGLRAEMEDALNSAGVWQFTAMGWKDAYTEDPETIGHAMWQVNPPIDADWTTFNARRPTRAVSTNEPAEWLKLLAMSGADFEGLMKAARLSIGFVLIQTKIIIASEFSDDDFFELHRMSAIIYLSMASDRLRDFLIAAAFRKSFSEYKSTGRLFRGDRRALYVTPFIEAEHVFVSSEVSEPLAKLRSMASEIQVMRDKRNELVHELATTMGRRERERIGRLKDAAAEDLKITFEELQVAIKAAREERANTFDQTIKELSNWYALLLRASNEAFIFENRRRPQER